MPGSTIPATVLAIVTEVSSDRSGNRRDKPIIRSSFSGFNSPVLLLWCHFDIDKFLATLDSQSHGVNVVDEGEFLSEFFARGDHAIVHKQDQVIGPQPSLLGQ